MSLGRRAVSPLRVRIPVVAGTLWVLGTLAIVGLAARWPAAWWALVPWGVAGAIARATVPRPAEEAAPRPLTLVLLGALLALQLAVLVLSRARGPLLGLLLGVAVAGFVLLVRRRAWKGLVAGALAVALLVGGLVLLNIPGSPLAPLARLPLLQRLSELSNVEHRNPVTFRLQVWDGVIRSWADQLRGNEIIPGTSPLLRSVVGYGLETELIALDPMAKRSLGHPRAGREGWTVYYLVDRAHNALLEQLMRGGLVGAGLWLALVPMLLIAAFSRIRESGTEEETSLRLGGVGAIVAHLAEVQVGLATPTSLALFWITAAWVTQPCWATAPDRSEAPVSRPRWWMAAVTAAVFLAMLTAWGTTQWLRASMAYARGAVLGIAGRSEEASPAFERSRALMPWLPLPAQAIAQTKLQLAATEADPTRQGRLLGEAEAALADVRRHALPGAADWALAAQIAFAQVRSGDRGKLEASLDGVCPRDEALTQEPGHPGPMGLGAAVCGRPRRRSPRGGAGARRLNRAEPGPMVRLGRARPGRPPARRPRRRGAGQPHGPEACATDCAAWPQRRDAVRRVDLSG